jgi:hypothetical protein
VNALGLLLALVAAPVTGDPPPGAAASAPAQPAPVFVPGERVTVRHELATTNEMQLFVGAQPMSAAPIRSEASVKTVQALELVTSTGKTLTVKTVGPLLEGQQRPQSARVFTVECAEDAAVVAVSPAPTKAETDVAPQTCATIRALVESRQILAGSDDVRTVDRPKSLFPAGYLPPGQAWTLRLRPPPSAVAFDVEIEGTAAPAAKWSGTVTAGASADDLTVEIHGEGSQPWEAPSGEPMTVQSTYRVLSTRSVTRQQSTP